MVRRLIMAVVVIDIYVLLCTLCSSNYAICCNLSPLLEPVDLMVMAVAK